MTAPRAPATPSRPPARLLVAAALLLVAVSPADAQTAAKTAAKAWSPPPPAADLKAAMDKVAAGSPEDLTALADSGRADAQVYAGVLYVFGRGKIAADPPRGCAYAAKAAETRPDAMHLRARCLQMGLAGPVDLKGAEAAYTRASEMGNPKSKCALGQMLMGQADTLPRGVALCKEAAKAGDDEASRFLGAAYLAGDRVAKDPKEARRWWELAAQQNPALGARRLGEMYANGEGGKVDPKKALAQWIAAEKAGDQLACILVADQLFSQISGGRKPGPGRYAFKGGVPTGDIEVAESWYKAALENDPRPDVRQRAQYALAILKSFTTVTATTKKS